MQRTPVKSTAIASIGYDDQRILEIEFTNEAIHQYHDVPAGTHRALIDADSIGQYFLEEIRDKFRDTKIAGSMPAKFRLPKLPDVEGLDPLAQLDRQISRKTRPRRPR